MPIPDFQALLLPVLRLAGDNAEHTITSTTERLASEFKLTEQEKEAIYSSGNGLIFKDRVSWARSYAKMAGLLESPRRGYLRITERGQKLLQESPTVLSLSLLKQKYADFREKIEEIAKTTTSNASSANGITTITAPTASPRDTLNTAFQQWDNALEQELLERMQQLPWQAFERLVVDLLVKMGYGGSFAEAGEAFQKGNDGGIDGVIKADRLGFDKLYVQAKRWQSGSSVGRPDVQSFAGAILGKAAKGVFITTAKFSTEARSYEALQSNLVLIDGKELAQLMIDYNVGVSTENTILLKRLDNDYFDQEL